MSFKEGDFLEVEYTVTEPVENRVVATTDRKKAEEAKIFSQNTRYGPILVIVGANGTIKGLDREIRNMGDGEARKFTFKPTDAFGERNEELVRVMPLSEFKEHDIDPYPGMQINLDDATATVKSVSSGRVVVDLNHPLAGKEVIYDVKVVKQITSEKDKVGAIADGYNVKPSALNVNADRVEISYNNSVAKNADYFVGRATAIASIFMNLKNVKAIDVKEEYLRPAEEKK